LTGAHLPVEQKKETTMAKDQFKAKQKDKSLVSRFSALPLIDKGDDFLCIDANFNFLMVKKDRLEQFQHFALPEIFDPIISEQAKQAARTYLPKDQKQLDMLQAHLKNKGVEGFVDLYNKAVNN
jgi:hypothetical protein